MFSFFSAYSERLISKYEMFDTLLSFSASVAARGSVHTSYEKAGYETTKNAVVV